MAYLPRYPDSKEQNKGLKFCKTYNGSKENYEIFQGHQRKKKPSQIHSEKPVMHQVFWHTGSLLSKLIKVPVSYTFLSLTSSQVRYTSCSKDGNKLFFICSPFKFSSLKQSLLKKKSTSSNKLFSHLISRFLITHVLYSLNINLPDSYLYFNSNISYSETQFTKFGATSKLTTELCCSKLMAQNNEARQQC